MTAATLNDHPALDDIRADVACGDATLTLTGRLVRVWVSPTEDDPRTMDEAYVIHVDALVCDGCGDYMLDELSPGVPGRIETETCAGYYCPDCMKYGDSHVCCAEHFGDPDRDRGDE